MTPDERKQLRSEVKLVQSIQRANGENRTGIHETERTIMEQRRVQEALEKASPGFLGDGHGLRGPQPAAPMQLDGMDGWGNSFQVKRRHGSADQGGVVAGAASNPPVVPPVLNKRARFLAQNAGVVSVETIAFTGETV